MLLQVSDDAKTSKPALEFANSLSASPSKNQYILTNKEINPPNNSIKLKIGDYNLFVKENKCGILDTEIKESLNKLDEQDKSIERKLAKENFSKNENIIKSKYETLLKKCS